MTNMERLVEIINRLTEDISFEPEDVARITGLKLRPVLKESTPYFLMLRSEPYPERPITEVELRYPSANSATSNAFLILRVNPEQGIDQAQVQAHFGHDAHMNTPMPTMPPGSPFYLVYTTDWGTIQFGFEPKGRQRLTTVVLAPDDVPKVPAETESAPDSDS